MSSSLKEMAQRIKDKLLVSDVVRRKVSLKRRGREFVGLSPFSSEKTPSFTVNDEKQFWHCFSSNQSGDIFTFLEKTENISFKDALEMLSEQVGITLPPSWPSSSFVGGGERARTSATATMSPVAKNRTLFDIMNLAAYFFSSYLDGSSGSFARAYLDHREISNKTRNTFRLGYAPNSHELKSFLISKDITLDDMQLLGLLNEDASYVRFKNRLIFPICDTRGRVIAFGGRTLRNDYRKSPKYINSTQTPLYHKGNVLFNYHQARTFVKESNDLYIVEGYMDVISFYQAGIKNVVAPLGTAMTENQLYSAWRLCSEPTICFDGDAAGLHAAENLVDRALSCLKPGFSLNFVFLPVSLDPDDLVKKVGALETRSFLNNKKQPLVDVVWDILKRTPIQTPERRAFLIEKISAIVRTIPHPTLAWQYKKELMQRLYFFLREAQSRQFLLHKKKDKELVSQELEEKIFLENQIDKHDKEVDFLLYLLICYPEYLKNQLVHLEYLRSDYPKQQKFLSFVIDCIALHDTTSKKDLEKEIVKNGFDKYLSYLHSLQYLLDKEELLKNEFFVQGLFERIICERERQRGIRVDLNIAHSMFDNDQSDQAMDILRDVHARQCSSRGET